MEQQETTVMDAQQVASVSTDDVKSFLDQVGKKSSVKTYKTYLNHLTTNHFDDFALVLSDPVSVAIALKQKGLDEQSVTRVFKHVKIIMNLILKDKDFKQRFQVIKIDVIENYKTSIVASVFAKTPSPNKDDNSAEPLPKTPEAETNTHMEPPGTDDDLSDAESDATTVASHEKFGEKRRQLFAPQKGSNIYDTVRELKNDVKRAVDFSNGLIDQIDAMKQCIPPSYAELTTAVQTISANVGEMQSKIASQDKKIEFVMGMIVRLLDGCSAEVKLKLLDALVAEKLRDLALL